MSTQKDEHGHLNNIAPWNSALAKTIAYDNQIALSQEHWLILNFARDYYQQYGTMPRIRHLLKYLREEKGLSQANSIFLQNLFPPSAIKQIAKIAGLPEPKHCA